MGRIAGNNIAWPQSATRSCSAVTSPGGTLAPGLVINHHQASRSNAPWTLRPSGRRRIGHTEGGAAVTSSPPAENG